MSKVPSSSDGPLLGIRQTLWKALTRKAFSGDHKNTERQILVTAMSPIEFSSEKSWQLIPTR